MVEWRLFELCSFNVSFSFIPFDSDGLFCNQFIIIIHCQKPSGKKDSIGVSRVFRLFTGYVRSILRVSGTNGKNKTIWWCSHVSGFIIIWTILWYTVCVYIILVFRHRIGVNFSNTSHPMPGYRRANHLDWRSKEALFVLSAYLCSTLNSCQSLRVASSDNIGEYLMLIFTLIRRYFSMPSWVWSRRRLMLLIKVKYVYPGMYPCLQSCH